MTSLLKFDQTTLANMSAAPEYVYQKLPPDRDNPPIRRYIAQQIISPANGGQTAFAGLANAGLTIVSHQDAPWLKIFE
jgi:hypothetical protein